LIPDKNRPTIKLGANLGLTNTRTEKSMRNAMAMSLVTEKSPDNQAFMNATIATKNTMPAPALASRSLSTATPYSGSRLPNWKTLKIDPQK
jgi:hypothetical protein